jgi:hypothetical protein
VDDVAVTAVVVHVVGQTSSASCSGGHG